jgi:hypothetical protein
MTRQVKHIRRSKKGKAFFAGHKMVRIIDADRKQKFCPKCGGDVFRVSTRQRKTGKDTGYWVSHEICNRCGTRREYNHAAFINTHIRGLLDLGQSEHDEMKISKARMENDLKKRGITYSGGKIKKSIRLEVRPQNSSELERMNEFGMADPMNQKFRNKKTGEIRAVIPLLDIANWEKVG